MAAHCRPRTAALAYQLLLVAIGSMLIAASAQIVVPMFPVPVTGQTFAVLLIGALYGSRLGAATVLAYLLEGAAGLPVFAQFGGGIHVLGGLTGGYLLGFLPAAFIVGRLADAGWDRRPGSAAIAMLIGTIVLYVPGLIQLAFFVGVDRVFTLGLVPFLPGAIVKIALATALLPLGWRALGTLEARFGGR